MNVKLDKNSLLSILNDWNLWNHDLKTGVERRGYLEKLQAWLKTNQILVITGPRRAGKSFLMRQLAKKLIQSGVPLSEILMVNFEDPRFGSLNTQVLDEIYKGYLEILNPKGKPYLFLDEIQEVTDWEKWVRMMHELDKVKLIISGSNARLLSQELATLLTGRHLSLTVFPFSFQEQAQSIPCASELEQDHHRVELSRLMNEQIEFGSFPEIAHTPLEERKQVLLQYYDDILNRDLIRRYRVRKPEQLKSLARYYFSQQGSLITFSSIEKFLHISADTIEKFSSYFEEAYLFFFVKRFSFKMKEQGKSPRKVYAVDTGLANAIGFRSSPNWGRLMEGLVFLHLARKRVETPDFEIYYWKDDQHREVDFVIKEQLKVSQLIQVCWLSSSGVSEDPAQYQTKIRETQSLLRGLEAFKKNEGWVITENYEATEEIEGKQIHFLPLLKWLLL